MRGFFALQTSAILQLGKEGEFLKKLQNGIARKNPGEKSRFDKLCRSQGF